MVKPSDNIALCTPATTNSIYSLVWGVSLSQQEDPEIESPWTLSMLRDFYPHLNPGLHAVDLLCYHSKISYQLFPKQFQPSWFSFIHTNAALQFCITKPQWNFPSHLYSSLSRVGHPLQHLCFPHNPYSC